LAPDRIDGAGNAYVTAGPSRALPTTAGASTYAQHPANCPRCRRTTPTGSSRKLNASGSALVYSTYLGGTDYDSPRGIASTAAHSLRDRRDPLDIDFPTTRARTARRATAPTTSSYTSWKQHRLASRTRPSSAARRSTTASASQSTRATTLTCSASELDRLPDDAAAPSNDGERRLRRHAQKLNPLAPHSSTRRLAGRASTGRRSSWTRRNATSQGGRLGRLPRRGRLRPDVDGSDASSQAEPGRVGGVYSTVLGARPTTAAAGVTPTQADAWLIGQPLDRLPDHRRRRRQRRRRRGDAVRLELNRPARRSSIHLYRRSNTAAPSTSRSIRRRTRTHRHTSRWTSGDTGAFGHGLHGDTSIFWGDAFVTKITSPPRLTPRRRRRSCPGHARVRRTATRAAARLRSGGTCASSATYEVRSDDSSTFWRR